MLEVNNIMWLYFLLWQIISIWTVINKFPKTFWLIFIDNRNTNSLRFFYFRPFLIVLKILIFFSWNNLFFLLFIQECGIIGVWWKIYIAIWTFMVKLKAIIVINIISFMLISSVWSNLEQNLRWKLSFELQFKSALSNISSF